MSSPLDQKELDTIEAVVLSIQDLSLKSKRKILEEVDNLMQQRPTVPIGKLGIDRLEELRYHIQLEQSREVNARDNTLSVDVRRNFYEGQLELIEELIRSNVGEKTE